MIGSHDSFTYLDSTSWVMNTIKRFWRCQNKTIEELYQGGCRFFDVRICRDKVSGKKVWRARHGSAKLKIYWYSIEDLCQYMENIGSDLLYRIWFEAGNDNEFNEFLTEINSLLDKHPNLVQIYRKDPETRIYQNEKYPQGMVWYTFDKWTAGNVIKMTFGKSILDFAKANNPKLSSDIYMLSRKDKCYFMDFCINYLN